jgi:hypothetical protein
MRTKSLLPCLIACGVAFLGIAFFAQAQTVTFARSQFRRTVDPSERSTVGTLLLRKQGSLETVDVAIRGLAQDSFAVYYSPNPNFPLSSFEVTSNFFVYSVSPLDRSNLKKGNWSVHLAGTNEAPPLIPTQFITDLDQIGADQFSIGKVTDIQTIVSVTNVIGNITNVIQGIPVPLQHRTNIVSVSMWAPAPALTANPRSLSYRAKGLLTTPAVPPVPKARGFVRYRFDGQSGRSVFEVQVFNLPRGQTPHVFIADSLSPTNNLTDAGTMTPTPSGRKDRYIRDTQFGDPLPQQARDAGDLAGRVIQILDLNGNPPFVYLEGNIP